MERKRNLIESFERWARKEEVGRIFPREIGIPREIANDEVDYIGYVTGRNRVDCYASVFSNWQIMRREFDTIFLDIDDHVDGLKGAYAKLQEVVDLLDGYEFRCYATGRGFHLYCLAMGEKVLRKDLRWVNVETLRVGDELITIEENASMPRGRKWQIARVEAVAIKEDDIYEVCFANGDKIRCTKDHKFLCRDHRAKTIWVSVKEMIDNFEGKRRDGKRKWKPKKIIVPKYLRVWDEYRDYDVGWLAGFYDGEGSLLQDETHHFHITASQKNKVVLERVLEILRREGFDYTLSKRQSGCHRIYLRGGVPEVLRFLGRVRPIGLLESLNYDFLCNRQSVALARELVEVKDIKYVGRGLVVAVKTSSGTMISNGYVSHNCDFDMTNIEDFGWAVRVWAKEKGILDYVDSAVLGDIRRMARLPETVNSAVGLECVEINVSSDYNSIKEAMKNGISTIVEVGKNSGLGNELLQCEKKHRRGRKKKVRKDYALTFDLKDMPPCMKEGINRLFATGELEHFWRVALAIFLLKVWGFDKTKELFRMAASDFNEGKTDYQLRYIKNRGFYTYSCKKLKMMGICSFSDLKDCPFYLVSNGWIENIIKEVKE